MRKIQPAIRSFLQITLVVPTPKREEAITKVFLPGRQRFLDRIPGAVTMDLLVREEDLQVLHGFDTMENASAYLKSPIGKEILGQLAEISDGKPSIAVYNVD